MTAGSPSVIERVEALLREALALSDSIDASLLGAKIDEAIQCARKEAAPLHDKD